MSDIAAGAAEEDVPGTGSPVRACLLGAEGSGKTCFLAGLGVLADPRRGGRLVIESADRDTAVRLGQLRETLRGGVWPNPTNLTELLTLEILDGDELLRLAVLDYPGEDFREAIGRLDGERNERLRNHFRDSDVLLLLFGPEDLEADESAATTDRLRAHLRAVFEVRTAARPLDAAVVLTKADLHGGLPSRGDAERLFRARLPEMAERLTQLGGRLAFFPLSAVGRQGENGGPPARPRPSGYENLFRWVLTRRRRRSRWRSARPWVGVGAATAVVSLLATAGLTGWSRWNEVRQQAVLSDAFVLADEKLRRTADSPHPGVRDERRRLIEAELARIRSDVDAAADRPSLDRPRRDLRSLLAADPGVLRPAIESQLARLAERDEELFFRQIERAREQRSPDLRGLISEYFDVHGNGRNAAQVARIEEQLKREARDAARRAVRGMPSSSPATLERKADAIDEFLQVYGREVPDEAAAMRSAAAWARRFAVPGEYQAVIKRYGGFATARSQSVRVLVGGEQAVEHVADDPSRVVTAHRRFRLRWQSGQPLRIVLRDLDYWDQDVGHWEDKGPLALRLLQGRRDMPTLDPEWTDADVPEGFVECETEDLDEATWRAVKNYLSPGDAW